ncbi:MAG TPA: SDR family NAD(P)-dependent oxidoreductase, partial [Flavitalea sp.]|nr:SDR family NAD(P)-dependent oxidoreductase [Flavitalea sp.]
MNRLENKIAFITGGGRGMGADITKRLAAEGASVVLTYSKSKTKAEGVAEEINNSGGKAIAIKADSGDTQAVTDAVNKTISEFGRIDILVNNAGIYIGKDFADHTLEDY